jgi:NitT/TauT family transport system substrate-binding protein
MCEAPQYIVRDLLKAEGFTAVEYVKLDIANPAAEGRLERQLATGTIDMGFNFAAPVVVQIDAGDPIALLAGVHAGCFELFGTDRVRAIRDLKGKTVAVSVLGAAQQIYVASMVAYIGLDPRKDVSFVASPAPEGIRLLSEGKVDAYLGFPPDPQELRARKIGRVVVNSAVDRPWSQYFCCMVVGNKEFVRRYPVATKRALRAILKATDLCALEPERAARSLVDGGFTSRYDHALQTIKELPYDKWRLWNPEDTMRFYALRLHEAGIIKSSPEKIIARGTDWRFLNELKRELKG